MNVDEVRRMKPRGQTWSWEAKLPPQRVTVRCEDCDWYVKDVLVGEGSRLYAKHRRHQRHA